ncbi:hypothetical protein CCUS01_04710 [Colletotrichum cuscutae]|uniref:Uncharacterized protein n=1 Tax=Colletotrichum cuscutae TaxID=1209917 RepID=A0AAI9VFU3_9PEZI|nr:hypothetical protein CCUS01_04710 [Colletotrichum cuscutae]
MAITVDVEATMGAQAFGTAVYSLEIPSIYFGITIGLTILIAVKASQQTVSIYMKTNSFFNLYVWMIWVLLIANLLQAIINWLFIRGDLLGTFGFFFGSCILWTLQTQLALQIIANRLGLSASSISQLPIWIPARLTQKEPFVRINEIWDRMEKIIYLIVDLTLNAIFLRKFNCNVAAVSVSLSMDILIIVMMSLPNPFLYAITHPVAYSVKLVIEMLMADLISTIARQPHQLLSRSDV